jgi:pyruvate,water dikinase
MKGKDLKQNLVYRVFVFIVLLSFILNMPAPFLSSAFASNNLTPKNTILTTSGRRQAIIKDLRKDFSSKQDGGEVDLSERLVVTFDEVGRDDGAIAGGKGSNLGEMYRFVPQVAVPYGIAVTTKAYRVHIEKGLVKNEKGETVTLKKYIDDRLARIEAAPGKYENGEALSEAAFDIRNAVEAAEIPQEVREAIGKGYQELCDKLGVKDLPVAVRSSATAEDLPDASFAGQQDTYLNMIGAEQVINAVRRNWASLFTDRAIYYRHQNNIDHGTTYLSAVIQQMVDSTVAGTAFTVEMGTGFPVYKIDGSYRLGEAVVSGAANPDTWILDKKFRFLRRDFGTKLAKFVPLKVTNVKAKEGIEKVDTTYEERHKWCLTDEQVKMVAKACEAIHNHYGKYMDIEWAFDSSGKLWIVQARPETVWNKWEQTDPDTVKIENTVVPDEIAAKAKILLSGVVGARSATGKVVIIDSSKEGPALGRELAKVKQGDIMVTTMTTPDMVPAMKRSGGIITDEGGPTCHAAIVARELKVPCVVGTRLASKLLKDGQVITIDANRGRIYEGELKIVTLQDNVHIPSLPVTKTKIGVIVASPFLAMSVSGFSKYLSHYGASLVRKEFVDTTEILVHPLAGMAYDKYFDPNFKDEAQKKWIKENIIDNEELMNSIQTTINGYKNYAEFYKDKLANAIALIAATQTGGQRIKFRTTDFKTNEYRDQIGGNLFEPHENNPMMGNRGIYRMLSEAYREAFEMELEAIAMARKLQPNIDVMFPVVRTVEELEEAVALMAKHGLFEGKDKCNIGMMVEVASNVILAEEFYDKLAELALKYKTKAFMSIGSNDLTQFTLALGRDNEKMKQFFNEADPGVKKALEIVIKTAKQDKYKVYYNEETKQYEYIITTGICGQRPSNDAPFCGFLVECGIDSIGVVPEVYKNVVMVTAQQEKILAEKGFNPAVTDFAMPSTLSMGNPKSVVAVEVDAAQVIKDINIHPRILLSYDKGEIKDEALKQEIKKILGDKTAREYVVDKVTSALVTKALNTPVNTAIIYSTDDLQKTVYETLKGGKDFEPFDENPQIGFNGLARVVDVDFQEFSLWQFAGVQKAREMTGRNNFGIRLDVVRTLEEVNKVMKLLNQAGLVAGEKGFVVGMEINILANVLLLDKYVQSGISFFTENKDRYLSYVFAEDFKSEFIQIPAARKEKGWLNSQKVWTNVAQKNNIPMMSFINEDEAARQAFVNENAAIIEPALRSATKQMADQLVAGGMDRERAIIYALGVISKKYAPDIKVEANVITAARQTALKLTTEQNIGPYVAFFDSLISLQAREIASARFEQQSIARKDGGSFAVAPVRVAAESAIIGDSLGADVGRSWSIINLIKNNIFDSIFGHSKNRETYIKAFTKSITAALVKKGIPEDIARIDARNQAFEDYEVIQAKRADEFSIKGGTPCSCLGSEKKNITLEEEISDVLKQLEIHYKNIDSKEKFLEQFKGKERYFAYEPTGKIGMGAKVKPKEEILPVHEAIYRWYVARYGQDAVDAVWGKSLKILYGASVTKDNIDEIMAVKTVIDGREIALVHGVLFATGGVSVEGFIGVAIGVNKAAIRDNAQYVCYVNMKSFNEQFYTEKKLSEPDPLTFIPKVFAAISEGKIDPARTILVIADYDGKLLRWKDAVSGKAAVAAFDGGRRVFSMDKLGQTMQERKIDALLMVFDLNVKVKGTKVEDDERIVNIVPTVKKAYNELPAQDMYILTSKGRPDGKVVAEESLDPVYDHAEKLFTEAGIAGVIYTRLPYDLSEAARIRAQVSAANPDKIRVFEFANARYYPQEESGDVEVRKQWQDQIFTVMGKSPEKVAVIGDYFDKIQRGEQASVEIVRRIPQAIRAGGLDLQEKIDKAMLFKDRAKGVFFAVAGGKKFDKYKQLGLLAKKAQVTGGKLAIIGALADPYLKSMGIEIGKSLMPKDSEMKDITKGLEKITKSKVDVMYPLDFITEGQAEPQETLTTDMLQIDIGPKTIKQMVDYIQNLQPGDGLVLNGGAGIFERKEASEGTIQLLMAASEAADKAVAVALAGGDMVKAAKELKAQVEERLGKPMSDKLIIISGGGALLEFLAKEIDELPAADALLEPEATATASVAADGGIIAEMANKLSVKETELDSFIHNEAAVFEAMEKGSYSFGLLVARMDSIAQAQELSMNEQPTIIMSPKLFNRGAAASFVSELLFADELRLVIYGNNAGQLKTLLSNQNIITVGDLAAAKEEITGFDRKHTVLLVTEEDNKEEISKYGSDLRQVLIPKDMPVNVALAKAVESAINNKQATEVLGDYLSGLENSVIVTQPEQSRQAMLAKLEEGLPFEFPDTVKATDKVIQIVEKTEQERIVFMNKV